MRDFRLVTCGDDMKHRTWRVVADKSDIDKSDISGEARCRDFLLL
jgi:hypothetical protein